MTKGVGSLFKLVSFGYGQHWTLAKPEAEMLGESLAECAATLTSKRLKALESLVDKVFPWVGLVGACAVTVYPRYMMTQQLIAEARRNEVFRSNGERIPVASGNGSSNGNGFAPGAAIETASDSGNGGITPNGAGGGRDVFGSH